MIRSDAIQMVRDNLDDATADVWSPARLQRILERERRQTFNVMRAINGGRWFRYDTYLTTVALQAEYTLNANDEEVIGVDKVAENGSALQIPIPLNPIPWPERTGYQGSPTYGFKGMGVFYVRVKGQSGNTVKPTKILGLLPVPQYANSTDFLVYTTRGPSSDWTAATGDDTFESGLPPVWEDLMIARTTLAAVRQRPPTEQGANWLNEWNKSVVEATRLATEATLELIKGRIPREVRDVGR